MRYRFFRTNDTLDQDSSLLLLRPIYGARCTINCSYCFEKDAPAVSEDHAFVDTRELHKELQKIRSASKRQNVLTGLIRDELKKILPTLNRKIVFRSEDIMNYADFFGLMDILRTGNKQVELYTSGVALDASTLKKLKQYPVYLNLSFFSSDKAVTSTMTGNKKAFTLLVQAFKQVVALGFEHMVHIVVTSENVSTLADTVMVLGSIGIRQVTLTPFLYQPRKIGKDTRDEKLHLYPDFTEFRRHISELGVRGQELHQRISVSLANIPLCQIPRHVLNLKKPHFRVLGRIFKNIDHWESLSACKRCLASADCMRLPPFYRSICSKITLEPITQKEHHQRLILNMKNSLPQITVMTGVAKK